MVDLISYFQSRQERLLTLLSDYVEMETPSGNLAKIEILARRVAMELSELGATVEIVQTEGGASLKASLFQGISRSAPLLVVGHFDTVWPLGTIERRPVRIDGGCLYGPGVFDMKAGLAVVIEAIAAIKRFNLTPQRPLDIFFSCDEERGSISTRSIIEDLAASCHAALVLEPCLPGGKVKTARKGIGQFYLKTFGLSTHAGVAPEKGVSAIEEMAHQVIKLHALTDHEKGISINVGRFGGGTFSNVVAAEASAEIDLRFWTQADGERILEELKKLSPVLKGASLKIDGGINRPPLERSKEVESLYHQAKQISKELGLELEEGSTGGGSDGNFIAALGKPVLDGLGPDGDGPHAEYEHIVIDGLAPRAALITKLIQTL
ncbi:MAG: M20 family metallopeptidase [Blastocatellia bacterium]|nr:M20 family metallopeptidase [Blastocatellia bacterium]